MISLTINGQTLEVKENTTVLQAAEQAGIVIPTLCHHKDLTPYGGCRLCSVDIQGMRLPATACTMLVSPGMVVHTESPALTRYRKTILELLLVRFYDAGYKKTNGALKPELDSQFAYWVNYYGIDMQKAMAHEPFRPIDSDPNPYIWVDKNKCIMCTRCVRACAEVQGRFVWTQAYRGYDLRIVAGADSTMLQSRCESCGACVAHCPTGALDNRMSVKLGHPDRTVTAICPYCGVGCQLYLNIKNDGTGERVISVDSNAKAPVNGDHLCLKGRYGYDFIYHPNRVLKPKVRRYLLEGKSKREIREQRTENGELISNHLLSNLWEWVEADWETALNIVAEKLASARKRHGGESVGLLTSAKSFNEENYLMNKLARQVLGTNNIDCGAHMIRGSIVEGLLGSLGLAAMSNSMDDIANNARSILVIGSNITENHPVFGTRIRQAVLRRKAKLITASPIFYNIEEYATLAMRYKRGSESALLNGLMKIILDNGWMDSKFIQERTQGFDELKATIEKVDLERVSQETRVPVEKIKQAAQVIAANRPCSVVWGADISHQGANADAVRNLANLQLMLGNLGVSGGGLAPLRSQNNSQGAFDMGGLPAYYSGYQPVAEKQSHKKFETAWGTELPSRPGLSAPEMMYAAERGALKALFVIGGNLWSDETGMSTRHALENCEFVAVCDVMASEGSHYADVLLPGVSFAEKSGTYTNTERRIQLVRKAIEPQGEARPGWQVISDLARRILTLSGRAPDGSYAAWTYATTGEIMKEIAALTPIYAGVSHERLERGDVLMWPVYSYADSGSPILFGTTFPVGKGKFVAVG